MGMAEVLPRVKKAKAGRLTCASQYFSSRAAAWKTADHGEDSSNFTLNLFAVGAFSSSLRRRAKCSPRQRSSAETQSHHTSGNSAWRASKWAKYSSIAATETTDVSNSPLMPAGYSSMKSNER